MSVIALNPLGALMETLDRVFQVVFARYRRKAGINLESAWRRAANRVSGYVVFPVASVTFVLVMAAYLLTSSGTPVEHKRTGQIIGGLAVGVVAYLMDCRFRKYLSTPQALPSSEARTDTQLYLLFRIVAVGIFILTFLLGFLLHQAGFGFLQGL